MAATYELKSKSYDGRYLILKCTQVRDIASNTSTINWTLTSTGGNNDYYSTGATTAKINAKQVYYKARTAWSSYAFPAARGSVSGSTVVQHDAQGKCSIPVSLATAIYTSTVTTTSGTWELDSIPRAATILTAPNFNDEENPAITYSNPAGTAVTSLKACIADSTGTTLFVPYRDISKTGTNYTFELTDTERATLQNATIDSSTLNVRFYVQTVIAGVTYLSSLQKTLTITNASPQVTAVIEDTGVTSVALTGDANKIIKGFNYVMANITTTGLKGAFIKEIKTTNGSSVVTGSRAAFGYTENNVFDILVTDSRNYSTSLRVTKELIDYVKLTCNLEATNPTTDGETTLKINGHYFNGSFGAVSNTLTVQYRYKVNDGDYNDWITVDAPRTNDTYDATINVTGLDYRKAYTFQARVTDKIETVESQEKRVKSIPVFDWGENGFQFNVPVYDENGNLLTPVAYYHADSNGYIHFGNGLLIQWGKVVITPTAANTVTQALIYFPITFDEVPKVNADVQVQYPNLVSHSVGGGTTTEAAKESMIIYMTRTNTAATQFQWLAVGYKAVDE